MKTRAARRLVAVGAAAILVVAGVVTSAAPAYAAGVTAAFTRTSSWETGFEGKYVITNGGTTALTSWTVAFDLPAGVTISSSWDSVRTDSGTRHTFTNAGWNGSVPVEARPPSASWRGEAARPPRLTVS
jgi:chitinase